MAKSPDAAPAERDRLAEAAVTPFDAPDWRQHRYRASVRRVRLTALAVLAVVVLAIAVVLAAPASRREPVPSARSVPGASTPAMAVATPAASIVPGPARRARRGPVRAHPVADRRPVFAPATVLLAFRAGLGARERRAIEAAAGATETRTIAGTVHVLRVGRDRVRAAVRTLRSQPGVRYAEPDYLMHASATPNDTRFGQQWAMQNTGQGVPAQGVPSETVGAASPGTPGADVAATAAWNVTTGSRSVVIGEVDTGVDYTHPDLAADVWTNPGGIGGCPAGTRGYNEVGQTCDPMDDDTSYGGHGTHVAGILGAVGDNGAGVAGVNWQTTILPVKWLDSSANGTTSNLIAALDWLVRAKQAGVNVRVVNDSATFYGTAYSQALSDEIDTLGANGILFVTAGGNTGNDIDDPANPQYMRYPCGYRRANEICVTATDDNDGLPSWANYGATSVDLAAPGTSIYSTLRNGTYGYLSGGSMASPMVAGAAALILSTEDLTPTALKADILDHVDPLPSLTGKVRTGGRLDLCRVLPNCGPPRAGTGTADSVQQNAAVLTGTVNPQAHATSYRFEYGPTTAYGSRAPAADVPVGTDTGEHSVSQSVSGLAPSTTYHFRIVAVSAAGTAYGGDATFTTPAAPSTTTTAPPSATTTAPPSTPAPPTRIRLGHGGTVVLDAHDRFFVPAATVSCGSGPCRIAAVARVTLTAHQARGKRSRTFTLGTVTLVVMSGRTVRISIRLTAAGRRLLADTSSLRATVSVTGSDATGALPRASVRVTISARRPGRTRR